jgi:dihydropyrimidine dehydrogenase (NAD+) subunit PreA
VRGKSSHGGYCGPAVKPIALHMVSACAQRVKIPISGIGGIATWADAAEFVALGATSLQVCTAVMHYGFRIVEDLIDGLDDYLDAKGFTDLSQLRGRAVNNVADWGDLDLNYKIIAHINSDLCIGCHLCYVACEDGAHQCIEEFPAGQSALQLGMFGKADGDNARVPRIIEDECVGCNLCALVCPVHGCITMKEVATGNPIMSWNDRMRQQRQNEGLGQTPSLWESSQ